MEKIFGPDVGTIKGKTTRRRPTPVIEDLIDIPRELKMAQQKVTVAIDGMTVNSLKFLTSIALNLYYRTAQYLRNSTASDLKDVIAEIFQVYRSGGFIIVELRCDNEFQPLDLYLSKKYEVNINFSNAQEHVPEAERNNRVIQERVRCAYHRMPYTHLPRALVKALVMESAKKLNFFPARHGVSTYYSPRMILHDKSLDYNKHCRFSTGDYVLGHNEPNPTNTQAGRALDCLYLRYTSSHQGGHELLHLATNKIINRRNVTKIPITEAIIQRVHNLARLENMQKGLKVTSKTNDLLYDSSWIAGVDFGYENDENSNENDDIENNDFYHIDEEESDIESQLYESENELDTGLDEESYTSYMEYDEENNTKITNPPTVQQDTSETPQDEPQNDEINQNDEIVDESDNEIDEQNGNGNENNQDSESEDDIQEPATTQRYETTTPVVKAITRSGRVSTSTTRLNLFQL